MTKRAEDFLVAVGAGHGLHTPGKRTPDGEREWTFNNKVVLALIDELHKLGIKTTRLDDPTGKRDVPLRERTNKANKANADILVSVHHNALRGIYEDHTGTEVYSYPGSKEGAKLAQMLQPELAKAYGLRDRGAKTANFHMLRESKMPAILTEGAYMDSRIDIKKLRDDNVLIEAGRTIARVIAKYLGVKDAEPVKVAKPVSKPKRTSKGEYTGNSIVDYLNHNKIDSSFANRKKLAREYLGISNYSGTAKQNTDLLNAMRNGVKNKIQPKSKPAPKKSKWTYKGGKWTGQILKQGDYGPQVEQLQKMLASHHFYPEKGAKNNGIDKYYGAKTANAVGRFQMMNGLKVDEIAGPATYRKLK